MQGAYVLLTGIALWASAAQPAQTSTPTPEELGENLVDPDRVPSTWGRGYRREGDLYVCENGTDGKVHRGLWFPVYLNQIKPEPFVAVAWSKAENVGGKPNLDYSLYLDIQFMDYSWKFGQIAPFDVGTHDWQRREVRIVPSKPVRWMQVYLLLRKHTGKAWFRRPTFHLLPTPAEVVRHDGGPQAKPREEFEEQNRTLAILGFVDREGAAEFDGLRTVLAEAVHSDLSRVEGMRLVERARVAPLLSEKSLHQSGRIDPATLEQVGQVLPAHYLLTGKTRFASGSVSLEGLLYRLGAAEPLARWNDQAPMEKLLELEGRLAEWVTRAVGLDPRRKRAPPPVRAGDAPTLAVFDLKNLSPSARLTPMEAGFAEMLQVQLDGVPNVRLVERGKLHALLREQQLATAGLVDAVTAAQMGRLLGAERLLYGSFCELGGRLRFDLRLADARSGLVVSALTASGPVADFASLVNDLAMQVAGDLAVQAGKAIPERMRETTLTQNLELAVHLAAAAKLYQEGKFADAAQAYERALVVEPENIQIGMRRTRAWFAARDFERTIEAGEQVLELPAAARLFSPTDGDYSWPGQFLTYLRSAYVTSGKNDDCARLHRRIVAMFPDSVIGEIYRSRIAADLARSNRHEEAIALLEDAVRAARQHKHRLRYETTLVNLFYYLAKNGRNAWENGPPLSKENALKRETEWNRRTAAVLDEGLQLAKTKRLRSWANYAYQYINLLSDKAAKKEWYQKVLDTYDWDPYLSNYARMDLGGLHLGKHEWDLALPYFRFMQEHPSRQDVNSFPAKQDIGRSRSDDRVLESFARHAVARCQYQLKHPEAAASFQSVLEEYGLCNSYGVSIMSVMKELGRPCRWARPAALVWGGGVAACEAWKKVLHPRGFRCIHNVMLDRVTAADLAGYDLVVLVRTGQIGSLPEEALALRNFVAAGGSLLVVISPGWEHGQPGVHYALMSLFGVTARGESAPTAASTWLAQHPITQGIGRITARSAIDLHTPEGTALVRAGSRTVLAALSHRRGRVVFSSLGQWFCPDPKLGFDHVARSEIHWSYYQSQDLLPLATGRALALPLLEGVVNWLAEPLADQGLQLHRARFAEIAQQVHEVQAGLASSEPLNAALEKFTGSLPSGDLREEGLWMAALSHTVTQRRPHFGMHLSPELLEVRRKPLLPDARFFERLVREYPQSPLRLYADWFAVETRRRRAYLEQEASLPEWAPPTAVIAALEKIEAPVGSPVWAWTRLQLGKAAFAQRQYPRALNYFRQVGQEMPNSPERAIALCDALCTEVALGHRTEAERYCQVIRTIPEFVFYCCPPAPACAPIFNAGRHFISRTWILPTQVLVEYQKPRPFQTGFLWLPNLRDAGKAAEHGPSPETH